MHAKTNNKAKTFGYLALAVLMIPTAAASVVATAAIPTGIATLFRLDMFVSSALALIPVGFIAKAFFEWMFRVPCKPIEYFLHVIGATCVVTGLYLLIMFGWSSDSHNEHTIALYATTALFSAAVIAIVGYSMKSFVLFSCHLSEAQEREHTGQSTQNGTGHASQPESEESERNALKESHETPKEKAVTREAELAELTEQEEKRKDALRRYEAGEIDADSACQALGHDWGPREYISAVRQCCFGPGECTLCGGCITGSGNCDFPGSFPGANAIEYCETRCQRCGAVQYD